MKIRVIIDQSFEPEDIADAEKLVQTAKDVFKKAKAVKETSGDIRASRYEIQQCYHDEIPSKPCEVIEEETINTLTAEEII